MKRTLCLASILFLLTNPCFAQDLFDIKQMADGVYAAIAKPTFILNCNAAIIVLDDSVLVVDTHSKPSAAAASLMDQIKKLTDKPVRYVVNTHFHWDHTQGNAAYPGAWPGVEMIASTATRDNIEKILPTRIKDEITSLPLRISVLKTNLASATDAKQKSDIQSNVDQAESYFAELRSMQVTLPTLTFDRSMVLYGKIRTIQILWLGNGHTNGDVWIYLPKEKILFCGDAMHARTPFMADSYPSDWIQTLAAAEKLDFTQAMGGHGDIIQGKERFAMWRQYFRDLLDETAKARGAGASLDDAQTNVAKILVDKYAAKFDANFPTSVTGNIAKAYEAAAGTKP